MKKLATTQDDYVRTALRLPRELHAQVRMTARANGHTMNAELIKRIAEAEDHAKIDRLLKQNDELKKMMREMLDSIEMLKR